MDCLSEKENWATANFQKSCKLEVSSSSILGYMTNLSLLFLALPSMKKLSLECSQPMSKTLLGLGWIVYKSFGLDV